MAMTNHPKIILKLETLSEGIPVMPSEAVGFYKQNCMICLNYHGHVTNVSMRVNFHDKDSYINISWTGEVTSLMKRQYGDLRRATDHAACAIALLLLRETSNYIGVEQSCIGTTIDYYLAPKNMDDTLIFNHTARLEVSGILEENKGNSVNNRINSKIRRLNLDSDLPTIIIVVEFSKPYSRIVKYEHSS